jgi:hypothetical protein
MQEIKIKLLHHGEEQDWSIEVDGRLHAHVSATTIDELVEYALIAAQQALLEPDSPPGSGATKDELVEYAWITPQQALLEPHPPPRITVTVH